MTVYGERSHQVSIAIDAATRLRGALAVPDDPVGIVVMAEVQSAGREDPRERRLATALGRAGLATLILDLLTPAEERSDRFTHRLHFDVPLLAGRLILATSWLRRQPDVYDLPVGVTAANTGAAAALTAAAHESDRIQAVVTRGGRLDLVQPGDATEVRAPTLVIVGGSDVPILAATRAALPRLRCPVELEIVPGAAHLFERRAELEQVLRLTCVWFRRELSGEEAITQPLLPTLPPERPRASRPEMQR